MIELFTYTVFSILFVSPVQFSLPAKAGVDAYSLVYPKDAEAGKEKITLTIAQFSVEAQQNMGMDNAGLMGYFKSTYLGTSKPAAAKKERVILGSKSEGETLSTKIPVASNIEVHLITLPDGNKLGIGFKSVQELPADELEDIISMILGGIKMK